MHTNKTNFKMLKMNTDLFIVRYSQTPHPDFQIIKFKGYEPKDESIKVELINKTTYNTQIKKLNKAKALYRCFDDKNEMAKALYDCFQKRDIIEIPSKYQSLISESQNDRPEIWV